MELLHSRTELLTDILDGINNDIGELETGEALLEKHRQTMDRVEKLKERLGERKKTAPRGPFV